MIELGPRSVVRCRSLRLVRFQRWYRIVSPQLMAPVPRKLRALGGPLGVLEGLRGSRVKQLLDSCTSRALSGLKD
jgi:hypothetical protein